MLELSVKYRENNPLINLKKFYPEKQEEKNLDNIINPVYKNENESHYYKNSEFYFDYGMSDLEYDGDIDKFVNNYISVEYDEDYEEYYESNYESESSDDEYVDEDYFPCE